VSRRRVRLGEWPDLAACCSQGGSQVRRIGPTEPHRLLGPTGSEPAAEPLHPAGVRCCTPSVAWRAPDPQLTGHGTVGCSAASGPVRTRGEDWRIAGRGLVVGAFLLCGWLMTSRACLCRPDRGAGPARIFHRHSSRPAAGTAWSGAWRTRHKPGAPPAPSLRRGNRTRQAQPSMNALPVPGARPGTGEAVPGRERLTGVSWAGTGRAKLCLDANG